MYCYADRRYVKCHYAECRGASKKTMGEKIPTIVPTDSALSPSK
jgi:hypothetical protein